MQRRVEPPYIVSPHLHTRQTDTAAKDDDGKEMSFSHNNENEGKGIDIDRAYTSG